jgi:hypothetical protein
MNAFRFHRTTSIQRRRHRFRRLSRSPHDSDSPGSEPSVSLVHACRGIDYLLELFSKTPVSKLAAVR